MIKRQFAQQNKHIILESADRSDVILKKLAAVTKACFGLCSCRVQKK